LKTFADIKRRMVKGAILECVRNTYRPELDGTLRRVEIAQTNAVAFQQPQADGTFLPEIPRRDLSWLYYPSNAKLVEIVDDDTFRVPIGVSDRAVHSVTLRFRGEG
jgi:hypothetical protein